MSSTIYDIAKASGVSIATVSRVLNKNARVLDETRENVLRVADEMGYQPKMWARNLANRRSNLITVIVPIVSNYFFLEVLAGMQERLNGTDYELNIFNVRAGGDLAENVESRIRRGMSDGFVLISMHLKQEELTRLKKFDLPVVLVDDYNAQFDSVSCDNVEGAYTATQYLLNKKHKRVGLISAVQTSLPAKERITGYKVAIQNAGRIVDPTVMYISTDKERDGFTERTGYEGMRELLQSDNPPDACFITSDVQGIGAMKAMRELGKSIPVICFDDIEMASYFGLSTMRQPLFELGAMAIDLILKRLETPTTEVKHTVFSPKLVERNVLM